MDHRANGTAREAGRPGDNSLYMVLKVAANGELREVVSQVRPGSSAHLFAVTSQDSRYENAHGVGPSGSRRNSFRHPKPCGACSATKSRCTPLPENPLLCVRCKSKNLRECPPHVPWRLRRANGERHDASGNPQTSSITQSQLPPMGPALPAAPAPAVMPHHSGPYSIHIGSQQHGQHAGGADRYPAYPYAPLNPEENLQQQGFYNMESGVLGADYSQTGPLPQLTFSPGPVTQQLYQHDSHVQPMNQYLQPNVQYNNWW